MTDNSSAPAYIKHKDYILVQVQEEASGFNIVNSLKPPHFEWEYPVDGDDPGTYDCADLPPGTWQLIGLAAEITEEHWYQIVEVEMFAEESICYVDYLDEESYFLKATESAQSLLRSHNLNENQTVILKLIEA